MVLRLLENVFVTENIESIHFYSCPQAKLPPGSYYQPPVPPFENCTGHKLFFFKKKQQSNKK